MKIIRVEKTYPVEFLESDGMKISLSRWIAYYNKEENTIFLSPEANWKTLFHEIIHRLVSLIPIQRLSYFIDVVLVDRYPRWITDEWQIW